MFSVKSYTDVKNTTLRSRIITVTFAEPYQEEVFNEETQLMELVDREGIVVETFRFRINEDEVRIRQTVKAYKDELNFVPPAIVGAIDDAPADVPVVPTQAELDFQEWVKDRADLKKLKELVAEGIIPANTTQQTNLQTKVNTGWKNAYFNQI